MKYFKIVKTEQCNFMRIVLYKNKEEIKNSHESIHRINR